MKNKLNRTILCIIDDLRSNQLFNFIERGFLPNFKKLIDNGIYSKNCVTDFPSITYPTQVSIITGTYTGDYKNELCHGIPVYNWMGRDTSPPDLRNYGSNRLDIFKMNDDLGENCQTLFEMIDGGNKSSITQFINRGTDYFFPENKLKLILFYLYIRNSINLSKTMARANNIVVNKLLDNFKNPKRYFNIKEPPICSIIWFMSPDVLLHKFGSDDKRYKLNLLHIDAVLGRLITELDNLGFLDETAIAITSDHGNYGAKRVGDLNNTLRALKLKHYHPRRKVHGNINISEFGGVGFFYFKGKINACNSKIWNYPTLSELENYGLKRINLTDELFKIDGVELLYYNDNYTYDNTNKVFLKRKLIDDERVIEGTLESKGSGKNMKTRYLLKNDEDNDIFGYSKDEKASKLLNGKYYSMDEWLDATYHLDYPLYPDLICRHFKNPRSADIILSTNGNIIYNLVHGKKINNDLFQHDIGKRESSIVPLIISGSEDIPKKEIPFCKITDIVPSLLALLGKSSHKSVVGKSII
ncbi:MAG: alkaline phosphatase family protein [Candidatus Lokiarchaeota archaeon]|nr:alkaline phosphatase family protein [Candidatus Lokiarchaeota archaeon]